MQGALTSHTGHTTVDSTSPVAAKFFLTDTLMFRFFQLGFNLLSHEFDGNHCIANSSIWNNLLPKICHFSPTVYAACAALGAAYETSSISGPMYGDIHITAKVWYHMALALLRKDIVLQSHGPIPLFLASLILAGVEALQRNLTNALMHIQGVFKIYTECIQENIRNATLPSQDRIVHAEKLALSHVVQNLDVQNVTYKLSNSLDLPSSHPGYLNLSHTSEPSPTKQAQSDLVSLFHACYSFHAEVSKYKYLPRSQIPPHIVMYQSRYITHLHQWLIRLEGESRPLPSPKSGDVDTPQSTPPREFSLSLLVQCLSTIIYLSSILSPYEIIFDSFQEHFQRLVDVAAVIMVSRKARADRPQFQFRLISSLSQPLFLTAMKCRDPKLRREAVSLLAQAGREGPWNAEILMAVAEKAMAIEEQWLSRQERGIASASSSESTEGAEGRTAEGLQIGSSIPERARILNCGMGHIVADSGSPVDGVVQNNCNEDKRRVIKFRFRRCLDVEKMIQALEKNGQVSSEDSEYWEKWDERIEV